MEKKTTYFLHGYERCLLDILTLGTLRILPHTHSGGYSSTGRMPLTLRTYFTPTLLTYTTYFTTPQNLHPLRNLRAIPHAQW